MPIMIEIHLVGDSAVNAAMSFSRDARDAAKSDQSGMRGQKVTFDLLALLFI